MQYQKVNAIISQILKEHKSISENISICNLSEIIMKSDLICHGSEALKHLAEVYPQLYLIPGAQESEEKYQDIVCRGMEPHSEDLSHFLTSEEDLLELIDTPAGSVEALTLNERADFERFLMIMANKCVPFEVPKTQGSSILDGVINWKKIHAHQKEWFEAEVKKGNLFPDWNREFKRFTADRNNYRDVLIVLSSGPYSNIPASAFGYTDMEWKGISGIIRKIHECTHFICRRKFPEKINKVWDEIVADSAGILAATGKFDLPAVQMEERFLGISEKGYAGGRLENYVEDKEQLDVIALKVHSTLLKIKNYYKENPFSDPFDFVLHLEERQDEWWDEKPE